MLFNVKNVKQVPLTATLLKKYPYKLKMKFKAYLDDLTNTFKKNSLAKVITKEKFINFLSLKRANEKNAFFLSQLTLTVY